MPFKVSMSSNEIKFSACHFLIGHSECSKLHGHNYYVSVEIMGELDNNGFVVDFIKLNKTLKEIVNPLDHQMLIPEKAEELKIEKKNESAYISVNGKNYVFPLSDICFLPLSATTSELFAKYIHTQLKESFPNKIIKVKIKESESSQAIYEE